MTRLIITIAAMMTLTAVGFAGEPKGVEISIKIPDPIALDAKSFENAQKAQELIAERAKIENELKLLSENRKADNGNTMALLRKMLGVERSLTALLRDIDGISPTVVVRNTGTADATFKYGGDESQWILQVTGQGAVDVPFSGPMTADYRMGNPLTIRPGDSKEFTIEGLKYGKRNMSRWIFVEPGKYKVSASLKGPNLNLSSKPVEMTVTAK